MYFGGRGDGKLDEIVNLHRILRRGDGRRGFRIVEKLILKD